MAPIAEKRDTNIVGHPMDAVKNLTQQRAWAFSLW